MLKYTGYFIFAMLVFIGCSNLTNSTDASKPFLLTEQSEYTASIDENRDAVSFKISTTFTNSRDDSVFIPNCKDSFRFKLQKQVDGEWIKAYSPYILECFSPPIEIAPGSEFNDTLQITGGLSSNEPFPRFKAEQIEGTYRLVWIDVLSSFNANAHPFGEQIPSEQRISNTFEVLLPPTD